MPRIIRAPTLSYDVPSHWGGGNPRGGGERTIGQYFATKHCPICEQLTLDGICSNCRTRPQRSVVTLTEQCRRDEMTLSEITRVRSQALVELLCRDMSLVTDQGKGKSVPNSVNIIFLCHSQGRGDPQMRTEAGSHAGGPG